ncbi:MAG: alpha-L-rhamnosidase, partial [Planctomycetota bacterium]|nr:alpha-L-rhamnosidase [Planctomycetota bacterium]
LLFFQSATLLSKAASVLGRRIEAKRYAALARRIAGAFNAHFLKDGRYEKASQTINAMALALGVVPEKNRESVLRDLVEDIERRGCRLSTGFIGTKWLLPALTEHGRADIARRLLLRRHYPSWGYMIEKGATTIWELWDSDRKGADMNSRNHFAFGSVGEWIVRYLAGIDIASDGAGFSRILIRPHPGEPEGELRSVKASLDTMCGKVSCEWEVSAERFDMLVRIPPNARATVAIPARSVKSVTEGGRPLSKAPGVRKFGPAGGRIVCSVGSGEYGFSVRT